MRGSKNDFYGWQLQSLDWSDYFLAASQEDCHYCHVSSG